MSAVTNKTSKLTPRLVEVLAAIAALTKLRGYPPTWRELGYKIGVRSTNATNDFLVRLKRLGLIAVDAATARGLLVTEEGLQLLVDTKSKTGVFEVAGYSYRDVTDVAILRTDSYPSQD